MANMLFNWGEGAQSLSSIIVFKGVTLFLLNFFYLEVSQTYELGISSQSLLGIKLHSKGDVKNIPF